MPVLYSRFLANNSGLVQRFTDAIYKGQQFVLNNSAEDVASAIAPSFPDTDMKIITAVVQRYKDIGAFSENGIMVNEDFDRLCAILKNAGELTGDVKFEDIVDNRFALKSMG